MPRVAVTGYSEPPAPPRAPPAVAATYKSPGAWLADVQGAWDDMERYSHGAAQPGTPLLRDLVRANWMDKWEQLVSAVNDLRPHLPTP